MYGLENDKWKKLFYGTNTYMDYFHNNHLLITKGVVSSKNLLYTKLKDREINIKYIQIKEERDYRLTTEFNSKAYKNHLYIPLKTSVLIIDLKTYKIIDEINLFKTIATQNNSIKDIFIDKVGNLWIATTGEGILIFPTSTVSTIKAYRYTPNTPKGLSSASTRAIYKDSATQKVWIGTYSEKKVIDIFSANSSKETLPINSYAFLIKEDKKDKSIFWMANFSSLVKVNKTSLKVTKTYFENLSLQALEINSDSTLLCADYDYVYLFNTKKEIIQKKIPVNKTTYIYQDKSKTIWLGTETNGFASLDLQTDKITYYNPEKNAVVKSLHVKCMYEDTKGKFWIATTKGLYNFDRITKKIKKFDVQNGLPNNTIYSLLEDENYNLWMSTNQGISKFDIENETFENFDVNDGLQDNEYNTHSFHKSKEGELFFGGIKGVDAFFPADLSKNQTKNSSSIFLTGFKQLGKEVEMDIPIEKVTQISLPIDSAQMLTFEFAALSFYQSKRNKYAYKINEIDTNWIQLGNKNELTLTGLAAGDYTLQIKGSNNQGVWNDEEEIKITITVIPPFWKQNWFLLTFLVLFLAGVYVLYQVRIYQLQQREEKLEIQIKERTKELATANRNKDQLFAIIAHDLRSPLTAFEDVSNQIEYFLRKNKPDRILELGRHIDTSIQGLNILLNNLLGWALVQQNHKIQINPQSMDLSEMVERIVLIYKNVAQSNQIHLKNFVKENTEILVDIDSFQTILRNLISNALKYTPPNGTVIIQTIQEKENVILTIQDTGVGMNKEMIKTIFQSTSIQSNRGIRGEKGTGLGLVLCQEFATLNHIKIEVESNENEGTIFYLIIPTKNKTV